MTAATPIDSAIAIESTVAPNLSATNLTIQSFKASANGLAAVWAFESENKFGQSIAKDAYRFGKDIFVQIFLPLLSLLWLSLGTAYRTARKPETKAVIIARYEALKAWASPKFDYERSEAVD